LSKSANLERLQKTLGVTFKDGSLLGQALVHRSYIHENPDFELADNERLEFLGDSLLGLVIAEKVYEDFPQLAEGGMTKLRAALVRRETLARLAESLGLGDYLYIGRGEDSSGGRAKQSILVGAFEAVIGAILIDQGFDVCRDFVRRIFADEVGRAVEERLGEDYKSQLQEVVQAKRRQAPAYRVVGVKGPDHDREFTVEVSVDGDVIGSGRGKSKRQAEMAAAQAALEGLSQD